MNDNLLYLLTILQCIENIKIYSAGYGNHEDFLWGNDRRDFNATITQLIAIGEESKKLDEVLKNKANNIKWKSIIGLRNILSHEYKIVDSEILWNTIQLKLNPLKEVCIQLVNELDISKEQLTEPLETEFYKDIRYLLD